MQLLAIEPLSKTAALRRFIAVVALLIGVVYSMAAQTNDIQSAGERQNVKANLALVSCIVRPSRDAQLATALPGIIDQVTVVAGQRVEQGQRLLQLRQSLVNTSLALAKAREQFSGRAVQRNRQLIDEGLLADSEIDRLQSEYAVAKLERQKIEAELSYLSLVAPFAGVVAEIMISEGEWSGESPVMRLINSDHLTLSITAKLASYEALAPASEITMLVHGEREPVTATVTERAPIVEAASGSFVVTAEFDNRQRGIIPGVACRAP